MFLKLSIFFVLCSLCQASLSILDRIRESIHDHSHIQNITSLCEVIRERLLKHGVVMSSISGCESESVDSEYGSTLSEVYSNFARIDPKFLREKEYDVVASRYNVSKWCAPEMFFPFGVDKWALKNVPELSFEFCYIDPHVRTRAPDCIPFKNDTVTTGDFSIEPTEPCEYSLELLNTRHLLVEEEHILQRNLPVLLPMDIASIWRHQMPEKLMASAHVIELKFP